jgi:hypothetical protein
MSEPQKFRKKPVVIEAMQWDGSAAGAGPVINWIVSGDGLANFYAQGEYFGGRPGAPLMSHKISIDTLEGKMAASAGDWIIRGVQGEFYPCKPEIFDATYDPAVPVAAPGAEEAKAQ